MKKTGLRWLWLSAMIVLLDQCVKYWVVTHFAYREVDTVLSFLNFTLVYNTGAAFSFLGKAGGWQIYFFAAISLLITVIFAVWLKRTPRVLIWRCLGLSLIIGGALGNFIDRVYLHYVIDFIDFHIKMWHFATFNIADSAVSIGAVCLIISMLRESKEKSHH